MDLCRDRVLNDVRKGKFCSCGVMVAKWELLSRSEMLFKSCLCVIYVKMTCLPRSGAVAKKAAVMEHSLSHPPVDELFLSVPAASKFYSLHLSLSAPLPGEDVLY